MSWLGNDWDYGWVRVVFTDWIVCLALALDFWTRVDRDASSINRLFIIILLKGLLEHGRCECGGGWGMGLVLTLSSDSRFVQSLGNIQGEQGERGVAAGYISLCKSGKEMNRG